MSNDNSDLTTRSHRLCVKINSRISESNVLPKSSNYKFSSHMFRKTKAYNLYHEKNEQLKEEARSAIGQSSGSQAIQFYI